MSRVVRSAGGTRHRGPGRLAGALALVAMVFVVVALVPVVPRAQAARARSGEWLASPSRPVRHAAPPRGRPHWQLAITGPASSVNGQAPLPFKDLWGASPASPALVNLAAVSCANVFFCAAVGQYQDAKGAFSGLLDVLWRGRWRAYVPPEPALDPAGGTPGVTGSASNFYSGLEAVSCPTVGSCTAVGSYRDSQGQVWGLIETFARGAWSATAAPEPARNVAGEGPGEVQTYTGLGAIACPSATSCVAVGMYNDAAEFSYGLIDTLSHGTWKALAAPEPAIDGEGAKVGSDNNGDQAGDLSSISCTSVEYCLAVGDYKDADDVEWPLVDELTGTSWHAAAAPEPVPAPAPAPAGRGKGSAAQNSFGFLSSVACARAGLCTAVGAYADDSHHRYGLVVALAVGKWSSAGAPEPTRDASGVAAGTAANDEADATLSSVACPSGSYCVSVGFYKDAKGSSTGLVDVFDQGAWKGVTAPLPGRDALGGDPARDSSGEADATLTTVSCQWDGICIGAGTYNDDLGNSIGLIDLLSGGSWQAVVAPAPAGPFQLGITTRQAVTVNAVSCSRDGTCALVGTYEDAQGDTFGLIDRYRL